MPVGNVILRFIKMKTDDAAVFDNPAHLISGSSGMDIIETGRYQYKISRLHAAGKGGFFNFR